MSHGLWSAMCCTEIQKQRLMTLFSPLLCQSSVLGAGFGDLGQAKRTQASPGAQILEQLKGPGLGQLSSSQATPPVSSQGSNTSIGRLPGLGAPVPPPSSSSWDMKTSESNTTSLSSQYSRRCTNGKVVLTFFFFFVYYISIYIHLFQICSRLFLVVVNPQVSLVCSQSLLLCWVSWFRGTRAPPCLWRVRRVHNRNSKHHLLQPRLLPNTPALQHRQARWWLLLVLNFLPRMQGWTLRATARHSSNGYSSKARNEGYLPRQR